MRPQTSASRKAAHELHGCAVWLTFNDYVDRVPREVRLARVKSCYKHLVCPFCAIRRGARLIVAYQKRLNVVREAMPQLRPHTFTVTVKDGEDLGERFEHLRHSWRALCKRRHGKGYERGREIEKFSGAVWSYETKRGKNSGLWHPHMHGVALCVGQVSENKFRDEWHAITGDSHVAQVRPMWGDEGAAFAEVFKYAVKFSDLPFADNWHAFQVLAGKRLVGSSGALFGVDVSDDNADELLPDERYVELFFRHFRGAGYVAQRSPASGVAPVGWIDRESA